MSAASDTVLAYHERTKHHLHRYAPAVAYTLGAAVSRLTPLAAYGRWLIVGELCLLNNIRLTLRIAPDRRRGLLAATSPTLSRGEGRREYRLTLARGA